MLCKLINIFVGGILLCKDFFLKTVGKLLGRVDVFILILGEWAYFFCRTRYFFAFKTEAGTFWERTASRHRRPTLFTDSVTVLYFYWISESITDFLNEIRSELWELAVAGAAKKCVSVCVFIWSGIRRRFVTKTFENVFFWLWIIEFKDYPLSK